MDETKNQEPAPETPPKEEEIEEAPIDIETFDVIGYAKQQMILSGQSKDIQRNFIVLGPKGAGKSSFLENVTGKSMKSSVGSLGLQYTYSHVIYFNQNINVNYFEINGGVESVDLIKYPINDVTLDNCAIFLVVEGDSSTKVYNQLKKWLAKLHEVLAEKEAEMIKNGHGELVQRLKEEKRSELDKHPDIKMGVKFKPTIVPINIVMHRFDEYTNLQPRDKLKVFNIVRAFAHLYCCSIISSASLDQLPICARKAKNIMQNYAYDGQMINLRLKGKGNHLKSFFLKHGNDEKYKIDDIKWRENIPYEMNIDDYCSNIQEEEAENQLEEPKFSDYPDEVIDAMHHTKEKILQDEIQMKLRGL